MCVTLIQVGRMEGVSPEKEKTIKRMKSIREDESSDMKMRAHGLLPGVSAVCWENVTEEPN